MGTVYLFTSEEHGRMTVHTQWSKIQGDFEISWKKGDKEISVIDNLSGRKTPIEFCSLRRITDDEERPIWTC